MLILACPGQGSQSKGFLQEWLDHYPTLRVRLDELSNFAGMDLVALGTQAEEEELRNTAVAQRLIVASGIAIAREVFAAQKIDGVVGHSVGEITAAAIAGVLTDEDAMRLVSVRADAMAEAASLTPSSMAAVLGGDQALVLATLENLGLEPANLNGAGQIVAAGSKEKILQLLASPPEKARVIELKVAGAFHTSFMESAVDKVKSFASQLSARQPVMKIWTNATGENISSGQQFLDLIVNQISQPVRWDLCMESLNQPGNQLVELPPAGALAGLLKRGADKVLSVALKSPGDLSKVNP